MLLDSTSLSYLGGFRLPEGTFGGSRFGYGGTVVVYNPENYSSLVKMTERAVNNYNLIRPHQSLKKISPVAFEEVLPAGGSSLSNDDFCIFSNSSQQHQKNHHLTTRPKSMLKKQIKTVSKTVNVF